jgi:hypothetical protein
MRHFHYLVSGVFLAFGCFVSVAGAAIIYESGTLGPTGVPRRDVSDQVVLGATISPFAYNGVKFQLSQPVITRQIGGHFVGSLGTTFFGAIVALENENDFPDSGDLSTPDVLGSMVTAFSEPSAEVFGDLELHLDPGWYALVFGSGFFGASGDGAALLNNPDIDNPTYIGHQPLSGFGWGNLINPIFRNYRFVVEGNVIPETSSIRIMLTMLVPLYPFWRRI